MAEPVWTSGVVLADRRPYIWDQPLRWKLQEGRDGNKSRVCQTELQRLQMGVSPGLARRTRADCPGAKTWHEWPDMSGAQKRSQATTDTGLGLGLMDVKPCVASMGRCAKPGCAMPGLVSTDAAAPHTRKRAA